MNTAIKVADKRFSVIALVLGQILFAITTFLWTVDGTYSVSAGAVMVFSMLCWAIGFFALFGWIEAKLFFYSRLGLVYALYGVIGGVGFAFEGTFTDALNFPGKMGLQAHKLFPFQTDLMLFWAGPAFPVSLLILGIVLAATKKVNWVTGILLSLGGITFPLGRILRIEWVAHLTDIILLAAVYLTALKMWKEEPER
jgi:hypothetical protein